MARSKADAAAAELARLKAARSGEDRTILAFDPGTACSGVAVLEHGAPAFMGVIRAKGATATDRIPAMCESVHRGLSEMFKRFPKIDTLVIEWQSIRPSDKRPNDILHLATILGAVLTVPRSPYVKLLMPLPAQWKGQTKPEVFDRRVRTALPTAAELMHDIPGHLQHNAIDALGLAAWAINERLPWRT